MPTKRSSTRPRRSTRLITNQTPCNISRQALYHVIGLGFTNAPAYTVPNSLAQHHKPLLDEAGKKRVQQIVGSFLYYARAVDPTI